MKYNLGDKLLCKNSYISKDYEFIKGQQYEIDYLGINSTIIGVADGYKPHTQSMWFNICVENVWYVKYHVRDYFYTPHEMRQFKLKELDKNKQ